MSYFDPEELRLEYNADAVANLLMCQFVDDGARIFPLNVLQPCMVGSSGLVVVAPPMVPGGKFRVLERHLETYYQVRGWWDEHEFKKGTICHLREADINQEIYGLPEWLPALQSTLLNEPATLFRHKYYNNDSHAGFIVYMTDTAQNETDVAALRSALKSAKGPGNFRNLFMYAPIGKKDGIQLIPVSEVAEKDEFGSIKNISRDDMLAALRIPPQLMGIVPQNAGGFGSINPHPWFRALPSAGLILKHESSAGSPEAAPPVRS